jgi:mercuric reductase
MGNIPRQKNLAQTAPGQEGQQWGDHSDLVILGSGSTAFAAAVRATELGKSVVMTEDRTLGGTCLNRGCVPSKNLIGAAQLVYDSSHPRYPGLQSAPMTFNMPELIEQKDELIRTYRQQHYASLLARDGMPGPRVVYGHATLVDPHTIEVRASDGSLHHLRGEQILIATGSSPFLPDITGLAETPYLTSDLLSSRERCL